MSKPGDFWGRRRAAVAAEAEAEKSAAEAEVLAQEHAALEEMSEEEILSALDLPDPDTLKQGDDFSVFMGKAVPDVIRRRALRVLWRSNPALANLDMLIDYGEDFTDAATVVENLQTTYQVGKGMLKHVQELARKAEEAKERTPEDGTQERPEQGLTVAADEQAHQETPVADAVETAPLPFEDLQNEEAELAYATPAPRRMKFRTEETA